MKKIDTNLYNELKERGLLYQCTDEEALKKALESGKPITIYEGSDPTADSLHIGHCVPYCILRKFQKAGHKVLVLMGGATACIGDPSGNTELRKMLTEITNAANIDITNDLFIKNSRLIMILSLNFFNYITYNEQNLS